MIFVKIDSSGNITRHTKHDTIAREIKVVSSTAVVCRKICHGVQEDESWCAGR